MKLLFAVLIFTGVETIAQDPQTLFDEGKQLKNTKSSEALLKFKKAVELKPDFTEARYEWAWCQNDTKDYAGAINNLKIVRQSWSTTAKVFFELGYAFDKTGNIDSAISAYNKCLSINPNYSLAHKYMGYIEYIKENYTNALPYFKKYTEVSVNEIKDYLFWYRKGFIENSVKDYTAAKTSLFNSLKYKTDYANTYLELGFACSRLKEDDAAIEHYKKAIEIDPKSHVPYNGIGEVYRDNKKDMNLAMEWYRKTLALNSNERKANFGMGYCMNSLEKFNEAIGYLKTAIANEKDYIAAYTELGYSYFKVNNYTDALISLNKSLSLNPNGHNPRYYLALVYIARKDKLKAQEAVNELKKLSSKYSDELQKKVDAL